METLEEYYRSSDTEGEDLYKLEDNLSTIAEKSAINDILKALIENDILANCKYRRDEFEFWKSVDRYQFDKLGFDTIDDLKSNAQEYLISRYSESQNILLRAKYALALWNSRLPNKITYGKACVDSFLDYINNLLTLPPKTERDYGNLISDIRDVDRLAHSIKYKLQELNLLFVDINAKDELFPDWFSVYVLEIIYDRRTEFSADFLNTCFLQLERIFKSLKDEFLKDEIYELALKLGAILKIPVFNWHNLIAGHYLDLSNSRNQIEPDFLIPEFYSKALNYYRLANNKEMVEKLNFNFQKIKSQNELPKVEFRTPINAEDSKYISDHKQATQTLINGLDQNGIFKFLAESREMLPAGSDAPLTGTFLQFASNSNYDRNGNFNHLPNKPLVNGISVCIAMFLREALNYCFTHGISAGKISAESAIEYFKTHTWIGKNEHSKYWIDLISPGLISFFECYQRFIAGETIAPVNLILATDSLTTKIEGIFRSYAQLNNVNTTKVEEEKIQGSKSVQTREVYMTELLTDNYPNFKELFEEKEYKFIKYLYTKDGQNIRNDIAHSFYKPEDYSLFKLSLIVLSLFRISKLKILGQP